MKNSYSKEYEILEDTIFTRIHDICIDPGHGGPTAQQYNNNGDGYGTLGCGNYYGDSLSEQWVNLQVAWKLLELMHGYLCPEYAFQRVVMTRIGETDIEQPPAGWRWRVRVSRYGNAGRAVNEFISIHHNGFQTMADQRVETWWCNWPQTDDSGFARDTSSTLAWKVSTKIYDYFNADQQCYECYKNQGAGLKCYDNFVLPKVVSTHVLTEASDIHLHCDERSLFEDPNGWHARVEANGIFEGWCSYKRNAGFVTVKIHALTGDDGWVFISPPQQNGAWFSSPYYSVWRDGETWRVDFPYRVSMGGVVDTFHHLRELENGIYSTIWSIIYTVPQCSTHTIIGYYKGGPFYANLYWPDGGQEWLVGNSEVIWWQGTDYGLDSTTLIDIFLDRNSGQNGFKETLFTDIPRRDYLAVGWEVTGPASKKCRIKIIAHDCVDNTATDVSSYDFTIRFPNIAGDANTDGSVTVADVVYLVNYFFKGGPPPDPLWKGDANGDCKVNVGDAVYLVSYLMKGGPTPICKDSCWGCMRALAKDDEKPYTKAPSFLEKIFKGNKESSEKRIESDFKSDSK
ncbi:MAG: N-acetylmuramoyl-L-alanine amidase [candidate division Zixibacteria bacterium]|nr:N-acetylmuramoyl-L-alanine amidase [candidate division Zixibacteria bacterium]